MPGEENVNGEYSWVLTSMKRRCVFRAYLNVVVDLSSERISKFETVGPIKDKDLRMKLSN